LSDAFSKNWFRLWVEGSITEYVKGLKERASLEWAVGVVKRAIESESLTKTEVFNIMDKIETKPWILPTVSREHKSIKLDKLRTAIRSL